MLVAAGGGAYVAFHDSGSNASTSPRVHSSPSSTTTTTTLPPTTTTAPRDPRRGNGQAITLAFGGDTHFEADLRTKVLADPNGGFLGPIAPILQGADLAMVNLETSVADTGTPLVKQYVFHAPAAAFSALRAAGVDVVTMANNHGTDYGQAGLDQTLADVNAAQFPVVGIGANDDQAFTPFRTEIKGQRVAVFGAAQVIEGLVASPTGGGVASAKDLTRLIAGIQAVRADSDTIVVYLHWGVEGDTCPEARPEGDRPAADRGRRGRRGREPLAPPGGRRAPRHRLRRLRARKLHLVQRIRSQRDHRRPPRHRHRPRHRQLPVGPGAHPGRGADPADRPRRRPGRRLLARPAGLRRPRPLSMPDQFRVLVGSEAFLAALAADVAGCSASLHVQFSTFEGDDSGEAFGKLLAECADRGLDVRLTVDHYSDVVLSDFHPLLVHRLPEIRQERVRTHALFDQLGTHGVGVRRTAPPGALGRFLLYRDHKKLVILDDRVAYVGGINVSDHNFTWHDLMVRIEGPTVATLAADYRSSWDGTDDALRRGAARRHLGRQPRRRPRVDPRRAPADDRRRRETLVIESPYLLGDRLERAIVGAADRGVRVTLIVPYRANRGIVRLLAPPHPRALPARQHRALRGYRDTGGMLHAKFAIVDGRRATFGSFNMFELESRGAEGAQRLHRRPRR